MCVYVYMNVCICVHFVFLLQAGFFVPYIEKRGKKCGEMWIITECLIFIIGFVKCHVDLLRRNTFNYLRF